MTSLKLSYSPSLSSVVEELGKFTRTHGLADVYYHGKVEDDAGPEDFRNALHVARLFPHTRVYVLHFADGQHYVGQSIDVLHRLRQHQRLHKDKGQDIEAISFRALGRKRLDLHEAELIHLLERKRFVLRNISMTSGLSEEPARFDELMPAADQARWLTDSSYQDTEGARPTPKARNESLRARYQELRGDPDYPSVLQVLRGYVRSALPAVKRAEATYWQLSCRPSKQVLVRINANWQEVLFVARDELGLYFYLCLSKLRLQPAFGDDLSGLTKRYPEIEWEDGWYRAGGGDQIRVWVWSPEAAERFVTDPDVVPALRHYNLRLMKRGRCPWASSHSFDLADDLMS